MKRTRTVLKDLTPIVQQLLENKTATRNDDMLLYCYFLNTQGISKNISLWELRHKIQTKQLPSIESVGRVRRKVQELHPELSPSMAMKDLRAEQQKEYKEYNKTTPTSINKRRTK